MRILVAFGTRPEIIKLAPVYRALRRTGVDLDVFWSGQHIELAAGLLELFQISVTHNGSDIASETGLAGKFGLMTRQIERLLKTTAYDWIGSGGYRDGGGCCDRRLYEPGSCCSCRGRPPHWRSQFALA